MKSKKNKKHFEQCSVLSYRHVLNLTCTRTIIFWPQPFVFCGFIDSQTMHEMIINLNESKEQTKKELHKPQASHRFIFNYYLIFFFFDYFPFKSRIRDGTKNPSHINKQSHEKYINCITCKGRLIFGQKKNKNY